MVLRTALLRTALYDLHVSLGARMVPFAGYEMPVQYPAGILTEHTHTREAAGLFDVSHMGQAFLTGPDHETVARALERLVPGDILGLAPSQIRYTQFTSPTGGTLDDLMVTRLAEDGRLYLVVNASRKAEDYAWMRAHLPQGITLEPLDRALVALQGPKAEAVLTRHAPQVAAMPFMTAAPALISGIAAHVSRSGYTGEDGYEISVGTSDVAALAQKLLAEPEVKPIGLGARDSLRLEAGLCLYGHELDENISPVEAALVWSIGKRRRTEGGFLGAERISRELRDGPARLRVGLKPEGRAPAREGTEIQDMDGRTIGIVTSGGFGASVGGPIAIGYVARDFVKPGTQVQLIVRGKPLAASVTTLPFIPTSYKKQEKRP